MGRYLIVRPEQKEEIKDGGIVVSDTPENGGTTPKGEILSVGDLVLMVGEKQLKNSDDLIGKTVFFRRYAAMNEIEVDGENLLAVQDDEIICVLN